MPEQTYEELQAENKRLKKLVEPKTWQGWDQIDSIYDEARLLRKERDEAVALVKELWNKWGEERILIQMGTEGLDKFRRIIGKES